MKAGAFDEINSNRKSLYDSIPNIILKSKSTFENKSINQIDLFDEQDDKNEEIIYDINDWPVEERLTKEFETLGFFISDHPLNQYKESYSLYKIIDYNEFTTNENIRDAIIAATILKIQEKKTQTGNSYAIIKLSDLSGVFELFIFSDIFEISREILKEGNSILITLIKNLSGEENRFKKINVKKIISLNEVINKSMKEVIFKLNDVNKLDLLKFLSDKNGNTDVKLQLSDHDKQLTFKLKEKRKVDRKIINSIKNNEISTLIN